MKFFIYYGNVISFTDVLLICYDNLVDRCRIIYHRTVTSSCMKCTESNFHTFSHFEAAGNEPRQVGWTTLEPNYVATRRHKG